MHEARPAISLFCSRKLTVLRRLTCILRDVCAGASDADAYERYLAHQGLHHPERTLQTRAEFFRSYTNTRWSGITRCC